MIIILLLFLILEIYLLNRVLKYFLLSPVYLYIIFSFLCIVLSVLYYYYFDDKFSLFELDNVSKTNFLGIIKMYIIALISFILGVILYYDQSTKKTKKLFNNAFTDKLFFTKIIFCLW